MEAGWEDNLFTILLPTGEKSWWACSVIAQKALYDNATDYSCLLK